MSTYMHGYKFRIYPTEEQVEQLDKFINIFRYVYNWGISKEQEIYDNTYNYFMSLTLEEQHKYINDNLDLRYYKDELLYDNKQSTARQVARRAVKYNKEFTNRYKVY